VNKRNSRPTGLVNVIRAMMGAAPAAMAAPVKSKKIAAPIEKIMANLIRRRLEDELPADSSVSRERRVINKGNEHGEKREAIPAAAAKATKPVPTVAGSGVWR